MTSAPPRLLVVDDNDNNRYTLTLLLDVEGYPDITVAEDGVEALEKLQEGEFDLMLLDVMMPRLNGYQVLEKLKSEGRIGNPPVVMISALDELESVVRCIELGAVDYLPKPFDPILLKARINATIERKKLEDEVRFHRDRMAAELDEARTLQLSLCPQVFPVPSATFPIEVFGRMEPARETGGDFFDFFELRDDLTCFVIGDVAGKGAPSALFSARTRDIVRLIAAREIDPAAIVAGTNDMLCQANPTMTFVTLFVAVLETSTGILTYANAGHDEPLLQTRGRVSALGGPKGPPVGILQAAIYTSTAIEFSAGQGIFLFTDGITEAMNTKGELYAGTRLEQLLQIACDAHPKALVDTVLAEIGAFAAGAEQSDDVTAFALRRL